MEIISRFFSLLGFFVLLGSITVLCEELRVSKNGYLNAPWISKHPRPPVPAWPDQFTSDFYLYVEIYGKDFRSKGAIFYDWTKKTFRGDYYDWCIPLFGGDNKNSSNYYTCSFLATDGNMYFVNHTAADGKWENNQCCLFAKGLGAIPPDWMKVGQYNGTGRINGILVDVWWFPGTSNPNKPCYVYWSAKSFLKRAVQFFGLSDLGPTILDYYTFSVAPPNANLTKPNNACNVECKPPLVYSKDFAADRFPRWPKWPKC